MVSPARFDSQAWQDGAPCRSAAKNSSSASVSIRVAASHSLALQNQNRRNGYRPRSTRIKFLAEQELKTVNREC